MEIDVNKKVRIVLLVFFALLFIFSAVMLIREGLDYKRSAEDYKDANEYGDLPSLDELNEFLSTWDGTEDSDFVTEHPADSGDHADSEESAAAPETSAGTAAPSSGGSSGSSSGGSSGSKKKTIEEMLAVDINKYKKVNSDVIGWIYIVGTDIYYPLLHYTDNEYYLRRSWKTKEYSRGGVIFMECKCEPDFSDYNTIIYGHRMRNETMFGKLKYFNSKSYWKKHPSVYIITESGVDRYDIYAAYEVSTDGETYKLYFGNDEAKQEYIDFTLRSSVINTGIVPTVNDKLLTLSTCSGNGYETRWIVQAVKVGS